METALYNVEGKCVGEIALPKEVFDVAWNPELVHQVITSVTANQRKGTAHAKDRSEVRGGGRKPWRQKGTGRARHGSIRSPIWVGGGATHGPRTDKVYTKRVPKKMARKALASLLSQKARDDEIVMLDEFSFPTVKTKEGAAFLNRLRSAKAITHLPKRGALIALPNDQAMLTRMFRNIPRAAAVVARDLGIENAARFSIIIFSQASLKNFLTHRYGTI